jgi:hypothetical protein
MIQAKFERSFGSLRRIEHRTTQKPRAFKMEGGDVMELTTPEWVLSLEEGCKDGTTPMGSGQQALGRFRTAGNQRDACYPGRAI